MTGNAMTSRLLWTIAGALYALSFLLFSVGAENGAALTDYRVWLLLALGTLVAAIGNVSRSIDDQR